MNKRFNLILMLVLLCCNHLVTAQDKASQTVSQLKQYVAERPQEKLFIHLDKPFYAQTDDIWFKVYLVEATNHLPRKDALVYVELVDVVGNVVATRNIQVLDGGGFGDFDLNELGVGAGEYIIRGYTNYMRNFDNAFFFHQKIEITDDQATKQYVAGGSSELFLEFFPEGGELVAGEVNYVAMKAYNSRGESLNIPVSIRDGAGNKIKDYKTEVFGMGKFPVIPEAGQTLVAEAQYEGQKYAFPLPVPLSEGYLLSVKNTGANVVVVARHSDKSKMKDAYMVVHQRGKFLGVIKANDKQFMQSAFKSAELPSGIITFTLFNGSGLPVRERIAFVNNEVVSQKGFAIETNKES